MDSKKVNKIDEQVEPPAKNTIPISGPPPRLSYAQVARKKQVKFYLMEFAIHGCSNHGFQDSYHFVNYCLINFICLCTEYRRIDLFLCTNLFKQLVYP